MVSREHKRAVLHEKLQLLRSITNSHALSKTSIIVEASKYIDELKKKVEKSKKDIELAHKPSNHSQQMVTVEIIDRGFLINIVYQKSCPGLLVSVMEAFEELGLNVIEARVSCTDTFQLEAIGENPDHDARIDVQVIRQAVLQAIRNCNGN